MLKNRFLFSNKHYLVVNKPPGVTTQFSKNPGPKNLVREVQLQHPTALTVHRIDKPVTGGFLLPLSKIAAQKFSKNLKKGGNFGYPFNRRYVALIKEKEALVESEEVEYTRKPGESVVESAGYVRSLDEEHGQMITKFIDVGINKKGLKLMILELETGKKHQIRKQLSKHFGSIVNDFDYGSDVAMGSFRQIGLHSAFISTTIGLTKNNHLIPVMDGRYDLWEGFVDKEGNFEHIVNDALEHFDEYFSGK